jgi:hypothetical protein
MAAIERRRRVAGALREWAIELRADDDDRRPEDAEEEVEDDD